MHTPVPFNEDHADGAFLLDEEDDQEIELEDKSEPTNDATVPSLGGLDEVETPIQAVQPDPSEETGAEPQDPPAFSGYSCGQCPGVTFQTKRELDLHVSVVHTLSAADSSPPPAEPVPADMEVLEPLVQVTSSSPGLPLGFSGSPKLPTAVSPTTPEPLDELACRWCPAHKRGGALPSKEALYQHVLGVHLRCPAPLVGNPCDTGPFPSRDALCKHIQAVHLLCPDCVQEPFRSHGAVHKHVQTTHSRCSFCSRGSYASSKALSDHIRAAHTSQHLRTTPSVSPKAVSTKPAPVAGSLKPGALYYVTDTDGLDYLAQVTQVPEEGTVQIQWIGYDTECLVPVATVSRVVDLSVGSFVVVNLGRQGEDCEQGELMDADPTLGQYSVRLLATGVQYSIGLEHLLDAIPVRAKQPCLAVAADGSIGRAEIISADPTKRSCTVRWARTDSAVGRSSIRLATTPISFDDLRHVLDLRKGFHCAVQPDKEVVYEAQILEVLWSQGECRICRLDNHQEVTVPVSSVAETWRGDHVLDEKSLVLAELPPTALTDDLDATEAREEEEEEPPAVDIYKPAMRFPVVPPDEKAKPKKDKKKNPEKEAAEGAPKAPPQPEPIPQTTPYPSAAATQYPPPTAPYPPGYSYSAAYAAAGYPPAHFAGYYGYGAAYPGYPAGYGTGYGYPMAYPTTTTPTAPTMTPASYGTGGKAAAFAGRGDGRRQSQGEGPRAARGRGKGPRGGKGEEASQAAGRFEGQQGWSISGPQPHRTLGGKYYHDVVRERALEEQQRTPPVTLPQLSEVPRTPAVKVLGDRVLRFIKFIAPSQEEVKKRYDLRLAIQKVLQAKLGRPSLQLLPYGSASSGLLQRDSGLDLCLLLENYNCNMSPLQVQSILRQAAHMLNAEGVGGTITTHLDEKFPYIRCVAEDFSFEISLSMYCAVRNSSLIRQYVFNNPLVRPLVLAIVGWAKQAGIHNRQEGLSTYTLTLMVLHYLLREGAVQCVPIQTQLPPAFDVCGFMPIADSMDATRLGMHVLGFFQFYSIYFRYQEHVVTIRTTYVVTRQSKQWTDPLAVEDPFEVFVNTAQAITDEKWLSIKHTIDSAYRSLYEGKVTEFLPETAMTTLRDVRQRAAPVFESQAQRFGPAQASTPQQNGFRPPLPFNPPRGGYPSPAASAAYSTAPASYASTPGEYDVYATAASQPAYPGAYGQRGAPKAGATATVPGYGPYRDYPPPTTAAAGYSAFGNAYASPEYVPSAGMQRGAPYQASRTEFGQRGGVAQSPWARFTP
eukprot:EG_transcript_685